MEELVACTDFKDIAIVLSSAIAAIATLSGVAITNFFNHRLARFNLESQNMQKDKERKLEKIEEIYFLYEKWEVAFSNIYLINFRCYVGKLNYLQVMELVKAQNSLLPGDAQKIKMLLNVHFPILTEAYKEVNEARGKIAPFLSDPAESKLSAKDFLAAQQNFEEVSAKFKTRISEQVSLV